VGQGQIFQDFPQKVFIAGFVEHLGVFYATTIRFVASLTTPAPYVSCIGQAAGRAFDKGNAMGSGTAKFKGTCRARGAVRLCCGSGKPPGALVSSLSLLFPSVSLLSYRLPDF